MLLRYETDNIKPEVVELAIDHVQEFVQLCFQPLVAICDGLRVVFTRDMNWEFKENPFCYNPHMTSRTMPEVSSPDSAHTILEILRFDIFLESLTSGSLILNKQQANRAHCQNVYIFPQKNNITVKLPTILVDLSIQSIYLLLSLIKLWTETGDRVSLTQVAYPLFV